MPEPVALSDLSATPKWRVFAGPVAVRPGTASRTNSGLIWSVSPGEWTVVGERPSGEAVDLTHVRAMFRLTGWKAGELINRVCALDLSEGMFPTGAAARTLFAGVATEVIRDDANGIPSYLILPSLSYATYLRDVIDDAGGEFGLSTDRVPVSV